MERSEMIRKAIFNMGGPKIAGRKLRVGVSTISNWVRQGCIPNLERAMFVAEGSGFDVNLLRPRFDPNVMV
jgi:hypothetical protein